MSVILQKVQVFSTKSRKYLKNYKRLYFIGNIDLIDSVCLTIVGSRKATEYGKRVVRDLCSNLVSYPITTVSGYVDGIDYNVFKYSLKNGVPTILVLGYGFDYFDNYKFIHEYKKYSLKQDYKDICIISQFDKKQSAAKWTFPSRDNLLASLGVLTLVIQAAEKSGTAYTVKQCLKESKKVLAVPGNIYDQQSVGTNNLLAEKGSKKAEVYRNYNDVIKHTSLKINNREPEQALSISVLSSEEKSLLSVVGGGSIHLDTLSKITDSSPEELAHILTKLEIKGFIHNSGGVYSRVA